MVGSACTQRPVVVSRGMPGDGSGHGDPAISTFVSVAEVVHRDNKTMRIW